MVPFLFRLAGDFINFTDTKPEAMDVNEVPQDPLEYKDRDKLKKLVYAVDKDGKYTGVSSAGWEAENFATKQAWDAIEEELAETAKEVKEGKTSPIAYFMHKKLMDVTLLAQHMGKWQWQVKRHMKPSVFQSLDQKLLQKYADVFGISVEELVNFGKQ
jgi:high-affinity Fe2+/Pb2+ permease